MRVTLMHNPTAGDEEHRLGTLCDLLADAGHEVVLQQSTKEPGWEAALRDPAELVVVAGGDGTVQKVFSELAAEPATIALLPIGSANNIARTLGYGGKELDEVVRGWATAERRRYDVGELTGPSGTTRFVESVGGGIFAAVLAHADARPDGEKKLELGLRLLRTIVEAAPALRWQLDGDGVDLTGEYLAVEVMNIRETGPNVPLAPDADPGDGRLDLVQVRERDRATLAGYVEDRLRGRRPQPPSLPVHRGVRFTLRPPAGCALHVDDELWPEASDASRSTIVATTGESRLELLVPG